MVTLLTKFNFEQRNYFHIFRGFGNLNALLPKLHTIFKLFFLFVINERFINLIGHFWCLISVFIYIYIVTDVLNRKEHSIESFIPYQFQRDGCFQGKACSHIPCMTLRWCLLAIRKFIIFASLQVSNYKRYLVSKMCWYWAVYACYGFRGNRWKRKRRGALSSLSICLHFFFFS